MTSGTPYGSHLVLSGLDVVRVSRQLGHARPSITLDVYSHEFEQAQHAGGCSSGFVERWSVPGSNR
jgi:hypothetical protein